MQKRWSALAAALFAFATVIGAAAMSPGQSLPEYMSSAQKVEWQRGSEPAGPAGLRSRASYPNYGPCGEVKAVCRRAGFVSGGARAGIGLALDCVRPIIEGRPQPARAIRPLPQINPRLIAACRASLGGALGPSQQPEPGYRAPSYGARTQPGYATPPRRYGAPPEEQATPVAPPPPRYGPPPTQDQSTIAAPPAPPRGGPPEDQSTNGAPPRSNPRPEDQDQPSVDQPTRGKSRPESSGPPQPKNPVELGGPPP
jgi:hypothetical protein